MTELQKEIFETIIDTAKNNLGEIHIYAPTQREIPLKTKVSHEMFSHQVALVIKNMLDTGYLKYRHPNSRFHAMLTDKGWRFTSFANQEKEENEKKQKAEMQDELLKKELQKINLDIDDLVNKLLDYDKVKDQAKWSIRWAAISGLAALAAILISLLKK